MNLTLILFRLIDTGQQLADSLVRNALSGGSGNRGGNSYGGSGGSGGSGGGEGGFLNALRYGGLFNENTGHGASGDKDKPRVTVSGAGPGGMFQNMTT